LEPPKSRKAFEAALQIRRELAQRNPKVYLPDLGETLHNLGNLVRDADLTLKQGLRR
jgi:hypothetical protein